jgi:DNA-binding NarL/FixJ family response regulator
VKIALVDHSPFINYALTNLLTESFSSVAFIDCHTGEGDVFDELRECDLIIMELIFRSCSGLEFIKSLRDHEIDIPILVFTMQNEEHFAERSLKAGATGYLMMSSAIEEIGYALKTVLNRRCYVSRNIAEKMADRLHGTGGNMPIERLSDRELQVLLLLASGISNSDIAQNLCLSPKTVSTYKSRIMEKMDFHNDKEILLYFLNQKV